MYFVDDVCDPEWKVVIQKGPRSKRVVAGSDEGTLSAAGHIDATTFLPGRAAQQGGEELEVDAEPVLGAHVEQVLAHQEDDLPEAAYADTDHVDEVEEDDDPDYNVEDDTEAIPIDPGTGMDL